MRVQGSGFRVQDLGFRIIPRIIDELDVCQYKPVCSRARIPYGNCQKKGERHLET